jgi:hypothetical protein
VTEEDLRKLKGVEGTELRRLARSEIYLAGACMIVWGAFAVYSGDPYCCSSATGDPVARRHVLGNANAVVFILIDDPQAGAMSRITGRD